MSSNELDEIIPEFSPRKLNDVQGVFTDTHINQINEDKKPEINVSDLPDVTINRYYYAVTRETKPRLFIIYVKNKKSGLHGKLTYNIVYIRNDDNEWRKHKQKRDITIGYDDIRRQMNEGRINMLKEIRLTSPQITDKIGLKLYNIGLNQNNISPPTFEYSGGRRKTKRNVKRRQGSRRRKYHN